MSEKPLRLTKRGKALIIVTAVLLLLCSFLYCLRIRESKLRRAEYTPKGYKFDNMVYEAIDHKEIEPYEETSKVVCKTKDGVWTIYQIDKYPGLDYVVARTGWEACVLKRVE